MKLDRNTNEGRGKYALLKLRVLDDVETGGPFTETHPDIVAAMKLLEANGILDWGIVGTDAEFFVIRLRDKFARSALLAYADAARSRDPEYAREVREMAERAGDLSPFCKVPD
jgi:hypothetical protein